MLQSNISETEKLQDMTETIQLFACCTRWLL